MKNIFSILILLFCSSLFGQQAITDVARNLEADLLWDSLSQTGILLKNGHQVQFRVGSDIAILDSVLLVSFGAPQNINGVVTVTQEFANSVKEYFSSAQPETFFRIGAILIDPGHGGKDPGAIATHTINGKKINMQEKDIVLDVSKSLYSKLVTRYPDKNILLTRDTDIFLTLDERVDIANTVKLKENEAILYISIHINSAFSKDASGFEVWYLSPKHRRTVLTEESLSETDKDLMPILNSMLEEEYTTESILIAKSILDGMAAQVGSLSRNRGLKAEEWFVVRNVYMPSVLLELGFISNAEEAALLADSGYLNKLSLGIYNGLQSFIDVFERSKGFTVSQ